MQKSIRTCIAMLIATMTFALPMAAQAVVIDFQNGPGGALVGNDYAASGVTFSNTYYSTCYGSFFAAGESDTCYNGLLDQSVSGAFLGTTDYVGASVIYPDNDTITTLDVFDSANNLLASVSSAPSAGFISVAIAGISSFTFSWSGSYAGHDDVIGIDNLTFNDVTPVAVPAPSALLLLGIGLGLIGRFRARNA